MNVWRCDRCGCRLCRCCAWRLGWSCRSSMPGCWTAGFWWWKQTWIFPVAPVTPRPMELFRSTIDTGTKSEDCDANRPARGRALASQECCVRLGDVVAGQDSAGRAVGAEVVRVLDMEQIGQPGAGTVDAALDSPDRASANFRRLFV